MKYIWVFVKSISQYINLISLTQAYSVSSFWFIGFTQWWDWEVVYHTQMKSLRIASVYCVLKPHVCPNCCCSAISHLNVLVWNLTGQKYQDEALQPVLVPSRHFLACIYAGVSYCICRDRLGWCVQRQQQLMTTARLQVALTQQFLNNRSRHLCGPCRQVTVSIACRKGCNLNETYIYMYFNVGDTVVAWTVLTCWLI